VNWDSALVKLPELVDVDSRSGLRPGSGSKRCQHSFGCTSRKEPSLPNTCYAQIYFPISHYQHG